ncbi:MAG: hypothetical protein JSR48_13775 [Verrucomicrobia bacterium]|nr:hypothetical protein [Verrucomicrobiota bacterium]
MTSFLRRLALLGALLTGAAVARAELPIIAKARAFVGTEAALEAVKSIHYVGSFVTPDPTDAKKMTFVTIDIVVQAPYQQRIAASSDRSVETTALDGYDAWRRVQDPKDPKAWRLSIVGKDQIRRLRANTWENLAFYRGLEREGGKVVDLGRVTVDGVECQKVAFVHGANITFVRYFDVATGRLVMTEVDNGVSVREQGEIRVNGVRFPKSVVTTTQGPNGQSQTVTIAFDQITVNETFPASLFAIPSLTAR